MRQQVVLLNQFVPPDPAPTARLAADLIGAVPEIDWRPIGTGRAYRARRGGFARRLLDEWADLRAMGRAVRRGGKPDAILAFSSPPMLLEEAARAARNHGVPLHHWVLDLYPDVAVAVSQIPALAGRWLGWRMRQALESCASVTAVDETMAGRIERCYGVRCGVCRPWPEVVKKEAFPGWAGVPHDAPVWLYSGNLGKAHDGRCLLEIQARLEERKTPWWLVVQGGGQGWSAGREEADRRGLRQCVFAPYAAAGQLGAAVDRALVCAATQRPETAGMLWPSKVAALAEQARAVLWIGPGLEGATHPLRARSGVGAFSPGQTEAAVEWLEAIRRRPPSAPEPNRVGLREAGLAYWRGVLLR